jgi:DNA modification methylase
VFPGSQPLITDPIFTLHQGDARNTATFLADLLGGEKLTTTITSPPYAWLKNYGHEAQIGHGQDLQSYLDDCSAVFAGVAAHTRSDGSLWLIVDSVVDKRAEISRLVPLPFLLADRAAAHGWVLRDVIVWQRVKGVPWSGRGRMRNAFEYVLHLVRNNSFKYNAAALRDPASAARWWVRFPERYHPAGPASTNVWDIPIPTQGAWSRTAARHTCPLPLELVARILRLSTDPGDIVFDPFAGIGSVVAQAAITGRRGLGIELDEQHVANYPDFLASQQLPSEGPRVSDGSVPTPKLIMNLRTLKRARVIVEQLRRADPTLPVIPVAAVLSDEPTEVNGTWNINATTLLLVDETAPLRKRVDRLAAVHSARNPMSKFGIDGEIIALGLIPFIRRLKYEARRWWVYRNGRTWQHEGSLEEPSVTDIRALAETARRHPHVLGSTPIWLEE